MACDPQVHHRRSIRLKGYDYTQPGAYFITIVTRRRMHLFGEIADGEMRLNDAGIIVADCWRKIPVIYHDRVDIDEFVIMPDHVHGIIIIRDGKNHPANSVGATQWVAPTIPIPQPGCGDPPRNTAATLTPNSIGSMIGQFKTAAAKQIIRIQYISGSSVWQRNYWEHIIRNEFELSQIREYIRNNPFRWQMDGGSFSNASTNYYS